MSSWQPLLLIAVVVMNGVVVGINPSLTSEVTEPTNNNGLTGHVCQVNETVERNVTKSVDSVCHDITNVRCGLFYLKTCSETKSRPCVKFVTATSHVNVSRDVCCDGWNESGDGACVIPVCKPPCDVGGTCIESRGVPGCLCQAGYQGNTCNQLTCDPPCEHWMNCHVTDDDATCTCPDGSKNCINHPRPLALESFDNGGSNATDAPVDPERDKKPSWLVSVIAIVTVSIISIVIATIICVLRKLSSHEAEERLSRWSESFRRRRKAGISNPVFILESSSLPPCHTIRRADDDVNGNQPGRPDSMATGTQPPHSPTESSNYYVDQEDTGMSMGYAYIDDIIGNRLPNPIRDHEPSHLAAGAGSVPGRRPLQAQLSEDLYEPIENLVRDLPSRRGHQQPRRPAPSRPEPTPNQYGNVGEADDAPGSGNEQNGEGIYEVPEDIPEPRYVTHIRPHSTNPLPDLPHGHSIDDTYDFAEACSGPESIYVNKEEAEYVTKPSVSPTDHYDVPREVKGANRNNSTRVKSLYPTGHYDLPKCHHQGVTRQNQHDRGSHNDGVTSGSEENIYHTVDDDYDSPSTVIGTNIENPLFGVEGVYENDEAVIDTISLGSDHIYETMA